LDKPPSAICARDSRLSAAVKQENARLAYQGLCRLYVGMTRAIRGLYLIMPEKGNQRSEVDLLKSVLGANPPTPWEIEGGTVNCWHETGRRDWFNAVEFVPDRSPRSKEQEARARPLGPLVRETAVQLQRRAPSGEESFRIRGADLLSPRRESARQLGTLVHELFAAVPWLDEGEVARASRPWKQIESGIRRVWSARGLDTSPAFAAAASRVLASLENKEIRAWFEHGTSPREAWCERGFDMILDRDWISGTFDRVVIERDAGGRATGATILDFKTPHRPS
jgi:ATP-dependent exoDNAse (exonuclease V) beta subunit